MHPPFGNSLGAYHVSVALRSPGDNEATTRHRWNPSNHDMPHVRSCSIWTRCTPSSVMTAGANRAPGCRVSRHLHRDPGTAAAADGASERQSARRIQHAGSAADLPAIARPQRGCSSGTILHVIQYHSRMCAYMATWLLASSSRNESYSDSFCHVQELAWATFAVLRNTNASGVLVWADGRTLAARGQLQRRQDGSDSLLDDSGAVGIACPR